MSQLTLPFVPDERFRTAIKEWQRDPSLLAFLRVLLFHYDHLEEASAQKTGENRATFNEQVKTMADVLQQIANGGHPGLPSFLTEIPIDHLAGLTQRVRQDDLAHFFRRFAVDKSTKLPPVLRGVVQKATAVKFLQDQLQESTRRQVGPNWGGWALQLLAQRPGPGEPPQVPLICLVEAAVQQYLQEVEEARKHAPETQAQWHQPAFYFLSRATRSQNGVEEIWDTPWRQAVFGVQIRWQGPSFEYEGFAVEQSNFSAFLRSWVSQNGVLSEPNDKTKELARLSEMGIQHDLLGDMRLRFPREAEEWFGTPLDEVPEQQPARHSPDFRSVHWYGTDYAFTGQQAAIVAVLWKAWQNGTPDVGHESLLAAAGAETKRLADAFKDHPSWMTMIAPGQTKGTARLRSQ